MKHLTTMHLEAYFDRDHHLNDAGIALYVDALKLEKEEFLPAVMTDHAEACQKCKAEILALDTITRDVEYQALGPHPFFDAGRAALPEKGATPSWRDTFRLHDFGTMARIAASLVFVIAVATLWYWRTQRQQAETQPGLAIEENVVDTDQDNTTAIPESSGIKEKELPEVAQKPQRAPAFEKSGLIDDDNELFAINFNVSPNMEDLVEQPYRSFGLSVETPAVGSEVAMPVVFQWKVHSGEPLQLKILDNKESVVFSTLPTGNQFLFPGPLDPGLYYWKLETEDELLYVGKFFIRRK